MSTPIPDDTLVIVGRNLGRVVRARRYGGADGYDVDTPRECSLDGYAPHFADAWYVKPAVIGVTVCRKPRGQCHCGYVHVHATELEWLPEEALEPATEPVKAPERAS